MNYSFDGIFCICLRETLAGYQAKHTGQATQYQVMEASLLDQLHEAQQQQKDAVEMCRGQWSTVWLSSTFLRTSTCEQITFPHSELNLKLQDAEEQHTLKEISMRESITNLTKEKGKLLSLSMERGRAIQVTEQSIQLWTKFALNFVQWTYRFLLNKGQSRGNTAAGDQIERRKKCQGHSRGQVNQTSTMFSLHWWLCQRSLIWFQV